VPLGREHLAATPSVHADSSACRGELAMEVRHPGAAAAHLEHVEGRTAFAERRAPRWA
jgi:hypothetical protein